MAIPTLETERLILRAPTMVDYEIYAQMMGSTRAQYMGGPFDKAQIWGWFCHDVGQWELFGHGALMIERKDDGEMVGQVSINGGPLFPEKELGWLLFDGYEGHGYVSEAALALREWAYTTLGLTTLVSYFDPANEKSINVAKRLGAELDPAAKVPEDADIAYRHQAPQRGSA